MASTYVQRKNDVLRALRKARAVYRRADSAGEMLERELDRLILRKTLISPESLRGMVDRYRAFAQMVTALNPALADVLTIASV